MSGLAAAKWLCARGVAVRVFEANGKVGGCCATTSIRGYTFNDGAVYLAILQMLDRLFEMLGLDRSRELPLRKISAIQSTALPDGTVVDISHGPKLAITSVQGAARSPPGSDHANSMDCWDFASGKEDISTLGRDFLGQNMRCKYLSAHTARSAGPATARTTNGAGRVQTSAGTPSRGSDACCARAGPAGKCGWRGHGLLLRASLLSPKTSL